MTDGPLLSVDDLRAGYGETEVLSGVSLSVRRGEVVGLVGRNGAGKTTTLRAITGALAPTGGTVTHAGEDVTGRAPEEVARRGVGFVPEERRVFPGLTVEENLAVGRLGSSDDARSHDVGSVFEVFEELADRRDSQAATLSGGEQQMLAIARALMAGTDLLLLDEPTEGLAPLVVERVVELVRSVNDDGVSVLLVEQNLAVATDLADRLYVLDGGSVVFEGTPADLADEPEVRDRHLGVGA